MKTLSSSKKYIFITGGVASSLGKGMAAASIASLLERQGIRVGMLKMDPYLNVDPGTMGPTQHGEVFVTDDGAETDLDLGHYERFTSLTMGKKNNFTSGQVYLQVIDQEREGAYLGKTVQVVPHITNEIQRRISLAAQDCEVLIGEIGGTVGDIESLPFLEAIRQMSLNEGRSHVLFIHLVLIPYLSCAGELKTKPAQHSVKELRSIGISPDMILCRCDRELPQDVLEKISLFCSVPLGHVFSCKDQQIIYQLPLDLHGQHLDKAILAHLSLKSTQEPDLKDFHTIIHNIKESKETVSIGIVGKYLLQGESYKSLTEALHHAAQHFQRKSKLTFIDAKELENLSPSEFEKRFDSIQGILVPGGFGVKGIEGKISAITFARTKKIPFLGICLGMQLALIELSRNLLHIPSATSEEFLPSLLSLSNQKDFSPTLVVHYLKGQQEQGKKGGTMRLGSFDCLLQEKTLAHMLYDTQTIQERHRHRLEINHQLFKTDKLEENGIIFSGTNPQLSLVEILELSQKVHPFFIASQFHPEFKSRPFAPHPLFKGFLKACL